MKRTIVAVLLVCLALPLFAEEARVMPAGVLRITTVLGYTSASGAYDDKGDYQDYKDDEPYEALSLWSLGLAAEFGVTDWITIAAQWTPAFYFGSELKNFDASALFAPLPVGEGDANVDGLADLFLGAKILVLGNNGLVQNEMFRFAVAPGIKLPMPEPDWDKQAENWNDEEAFTISAIDKHATGMGARVYFDWILNDMFFVNLYSEYIGYFEKKDALIPDGLFPDNPALAGPLAAIGLEPGANKADVGYGYDLTFEVEPVFEYMLGGDIRLGASLPVTWKGSPEIEIDGETIDDTDSYIFRMTPTVKAFFMKLPVPMELLLKYSIPMAGKNNETTSTFAILLRTFLRF